MSNYNLERCACGRIHLIRFDFTGSVKCQRCDLVAVCTFGHIHRFCNFRIGREGRQYSSRRQYCRTRGKGRKNVEGGGSL
ncbi:MAG: hypothetical protein KAR13_21455 [Desulfobulbaceae bacterium]|nr:hypothetical protein [Desulfobulbaceae bacterium]